METYWDAFINRYKEYLQDQSLRFILAAFWEYCQGNVEKSDEMLGGEAPMKDGGVEKDSTEEIYGGSVGTNPKTKSEMRRISIQSKGKN